MNYQPVYDAQSEATVVASLIYKPSLVMESDYLSGESFYDTEMGQIYDAIQSIFMSGKTPSYANLKKYVTTEYKHGGESGYLSDPIKFNELLEYSALVKVSTVEDYREVAKTVYDDFCKRSYYPKISALISDISTHKTKIEEINNKIYDISENMTRRFIINESVPEFGEAIDAVFSEMESESQSNELIRWKWDILNECAPLETGEMYLFSARRKGGKSMWLMNQAIYLLNHDIPVLYVDTEMSDKLMMVRMLSYLTKIETKVIKAIIRSGDYSSANGEKILKAKTWIKSKKFWHWYKPDFDAVKLRNMCRLLRDRYDCRVLIYDYMKDDSSDSTVVYNNLGRMTTVLKNNIGGELDMAVISAAQLNRQMEVADSDKMERYISVSFKILYKTCDEVGEYPDCGNMKCIVNANRLGEPHDVSDPEDYFDFAFVPSTMRIEQAPQHLRESISIFA